MDKIRAALYARLSKETEWMQGSAENLVSMKNILENVDLNQDFADAVGEEMRAIEARRIEIGTENVKVSLSGNELCVQDVWEDKEVHDMQATLILRLMKRSFKVFVRKSIHAQVWYMSKDVWELLQVRALDIADKN